MLAAPAVSAVVPCRNEAVHIQGCLLSLLQQDEPAGGFEIIVADGMSDDGTREILQKLAAADTRLRMVDNPGRITPCGMNCGIRASRGRWIAIMGSHNRYAPDYLVRCLEAARQTGADNVGGLMLSEGKGLRQRAIAAAHHSFFSVGGARWHNLEYEGPADTVFGGFYKRDVFDQLGLFDEELARNQDDELNLRLARAGGKIWQSARIKSFYSPRDSLSALFRQYAQYGYWKVRVVQKHTLPASWRHLVPGVFLVALVGLFGFSAFSFILSALRHNLAIAVSNVSFQLSALGFLGIFLAYLLAVLVASAQTASRAEWKLLPLLPPVFACYHFGYGYGFLRGIWDFMVRRKGPRQQFVQLTRTAPQVHNARR